MSKKCEKKFFKKDKNIVTKNGGKKARKKFYQNHTHIANKKPMEKNRLEKVRKHVFYKHTNIMTKKWGEKNARKNFPETHVNREFYRWKKSSGKSAKTRFL